MKLPVSNTNAPVWRDITVKSQLPAALKSLLVGLEQRSIEPVPRSRPRHLACNRRESGDATPAAPIRAS